MNKDRIAELLQEPARVAREDLAGLRELRERYPWFSGAHLLLALGENASGDVLFDETLRTTAAHVPSRQVLQDRTRSAPSVAIAARNEAPITPPAPTPVEEAAEQPAPALPTREELADRLLHQQIAEAAAASVYDLEAELEREEGATAPPPPPPASHPRAPAPIAPAARPLVRSFTGWLEDQTAPAIPARPQTAHRPDAAAAPALSPERSATVEKTRNAIDRFLDQGTPGPKKTSFFSPQQAGKRSLEERLDMVTETLARIHEKQGHWAKAAQAYRRLALKHPEKSGYFAALAKKAEENLNA